MSNVSKKELIILNLAGEISPELTHYFDQKKATLIDESNEEARSITHILTRGETNFFELSTRYNTISSNVKMISLSPLDDLQQFVMANGKLIIDEVWFTNGFGNFIMDKFFQDIGGISLEDSYPVFTEKGSFNITNPFNTGEYLDRMVHTAFQDGMSGLSIKTFFDHLIMYLTGLKTKGKVGLPIEVTYGYFQDVFGIQLHFFTQDLILEDLTLSLANNISKKAEEYLLNVAVHSSDFFDLTYLHDVNKAVITGLWTKDSKIKIENRGLLISDLSAAAAITQYPTKGVTSFLSGEPNITDLSDKIILPTATLINGGEEKSFSQTVSGKMALEDEVIVVKGGEDQSPEFIKVAGSAFEAEEVTVVKGSHVTEDQEKQTIHGAEEESETVTFLKGSHESSLPLMQIIKKGESTKPSHLMTSKTNDASLIEKSEKGDSPLRKLVNLVTASGNENQNNPFDFANQTPKDDRAKIQAFLKIKSLNDVFPEDIKNHFEEYLAKEKKSLKSANQKDLEGFKKTEIHKIMQHATEALPRKVDDLSATKIGDKTVQALQVENESLKSKMMTLLAEVKILKESKKQLSQINEKAMNLAEVSTEQKQSNHLDNLLRQEMLKKLQDQKGLGEQDSKKLFDLMERENKFIQGTKEQDAKLKKMQIELAQKESVFSHELESLQRQLKAKDMVLAKSKENVSILFERKEEEIALLNQKLGHANKMISNQNPQAQNLLIKDLEKQVSNHEKMIEIYKTQIANRPLEKSDDELMKDENRKLQLLNNQFKNQLDITKKDLQKLQERSAQDSASIMSLKADKLKLEQSLKKASMEVKKEEISSNAQPALENEIKKLKGLCDFYEGQIKEAQTRQRDQELKLQAALKNQKKETAAEDAIGKGRTGQLENNIRKLTQDLIESRNLMAEMKKESTKLRQEKIAFQNQIDKYKKDAEKAKGAVPKKTGAGGKAA